MTADWKAPKVCATCGSRFEPRLREGRLLYTRRRFCSAACVHVAMRRPAEERFWEKVDKTETCWNWIAGRSAEGYGRFNPVKGQSPVGAHRFSYATFVAPIPDGFEVDHLCRNTSCVRPDHLDAVPGEENWWRSASPSRINAEKNACKRGHVYNAANTRISKEGWRYCRACDRLAARRYRLKKKGETNAA